MIVKLYYISSLLDKCLLLILYRENSPVQRTFFFGLICSSHC